MVAVRDHGGDCIERYFPRVDLVHPIQHSSP